MKKVMVFGTFDIVHCGHLHMFTKAREYGDTLVVVVGRDKNVERIKGVEPFHNEGERLHFISHIDLVDKAVLGDKEDVYRVIREEKPDVIALGYDQKEYIDNLAREITKAGLTIEIVRLSEYQEHRFKSRILKKYMERIV
ncbi:MAG: FAD synthase [Candidatus Magasanikbacteria bacterium]|nr:FAD synthase [Candidatus Magasanikbacteria bacterium]